MSLAEKLAEIAEAGKQRMPEQVRNTLGQFVQSLRDSGIMERAIKVGDPLPAFSLPNANGEMVNSTDLLAKGPLVVTVFRGHW